MGRRERTLNGCCCCCSLLVTKGGQCSSARASFTLLFWPCVCIRDTNFFVSVYIYLQKKYFRRNVNNHLQCRCVCHHHHQQAWMDVSLCHLFFMYTYKSNNHMLLLLQASSFLPVLICQSYICRTWWWLGGDALAANVRAAWRRTNESIVVVLQTTGRIVFVLFSLSICHGVLFFSEKSDMNQTEKHCVLPTFTCVALNYAIRYNLLDTSNIFESTITKAKLLRRRRRRTIPISH